MGCRLGNPECWEENYHKLAENLRRESILFFENLTFAVDLVAVKEVSVEMLVVVIQ